MERIESLNGIWDNLTRSLSLIRDDVGKLYTILTDHKETVNSITNAFNLLSIERDELYKEVKLLKSQQMKNLTTVKEKPAKSIRVKDFKEINNGSTNKENNEKKKSSPATASIIVDLSSQSLFKDRKKSPGTSACDRSFEEIKDNFKEPPVRKKTQPQLKQQTLTDFSIMKNDLSDSTFCEKIEGKKKPPKSKWLKRSKTTVINNSKQLRQGNINKSFSNMTAQNTDQNVTSVGTVDFQFSNKTPPKEKLPATMIDTDRTPDLPFISPRKKVKIEKFSESLDIFGGEMDESSRESSNSVIIIDDPSQRPLTINDDTDDMNRELLESLERRMENITEFDSILVADEEKPDSEIPHFKPGVRYKDCGECFKFYKEKEAKNEVVAEIRPCPLNCVGYISRVTESKALRKMKTMPPPKIRDDENTPSGFWELDFPKSNNF